MASSWNNPKFARKAQGGNLASCANLEKESRDKYQGKKYLG